MRVCARVPKHAALPRDPDDNVEKITGAGQDGAAQMGVGYEQETLALAGAHLDSLLVETWRHCQSKSAWKLWNARVTCGAP